MSGLSTLRAIHRILIESQKGFKGALDFRLVPPSFAHEEENKEAERRSTLLHIKIRAALQVTPWVVLAKVDRGPGQDLSQ